MARSSWKDGLLIVSGGLMGAGIMALADPGHGAWRRSWLRDKMVRGMHLAAREGYKQACNARNHLFGVIAEQRAKLRDRDVSDTLLEQRVRAQLGHVLSHFSVDVRCDNGKVIVEGPVLQGEKQKICDRLNQTRGVRVYELRVTEHDSEQGLPSLQGVSRAQRRNIA